MMQATKNKLCTASAILKLDSLNSEVDCRVENGVIIIQPLHQYRKYSLQQLISQELDSVPKIDWGKSMGEEW